MLFNLFKIKKDIPAPWKKYYDDNEFNIKIPNISIYEQIKRTCLRYPNSVAIEYLGNKIKYKKFLKKIDRCAISFKYNGVKKGDIISICLPNVPEALICLYALNKIGAIGNMIHPLSAEEEIKESLISTKSKYLVMIDMFYSKVKNIISSTNVKKVIFVSASNSMKLYMKLPYKIMNIKKYEHYHLNKLYTNWFLFNLKSLFVNKKNIKFKKYTKNTPAVILHSGGTSGKPKNVVIQNRAFLLLTEQDKVIVKNMNVGEGCLAIMPNFHGFGLAVSMHVQIACGYKCILVPTFDPKKFDLLLNKTKPSIIFGVPTLFEALINSRNVKNLDLSNLKYVISGGDTLPKTLEDDVNRYLIKHNADTIITQGYGLTEALSAICLGTKKINKSGSIGIPMPGNYIKIINPATRERCKYNEVGEICIHNKALMLGYLNNETETNEALQMHDDGHIWLHTGDLGYMDEDGFTFYKGRSKRMIICSGYNVYPSHIESVIESHPAVLQCSVVGMPHPYKKEVPKAFIVLKSGFHGLFIKSEIKEFCKKNLEHHMVPYKFIYRKSLPKTKIGKVDFRKLMEDDGVDDE